MRHSINIIALLILISSCSNKKADKESTERDIETLDTSLNVNNNLLHKASISQLDNRVTERFLQLVKFLDSVGYKSDSINLKNRFNLPENNLFLVQNYLFYDCPLKETIPYLSYLTLKNDSLEDNNNIELQIDIEKFRKFKRITTHFLIKKSPEIIGGKKWFIDGIIEEWKFPNNRSAKEAAIENGKKADLIYFNVGAFICYIDNYMYIITSRSSLMMYYIKPLFKNFAEKNNVIVTQSY